MTHVVHNTNKRNQGKKVLFSIIAGTFCLFLSFLGTSDYEHEALFQDINSPQQTSSSTPHHQQSELPLSATHIPAQLPSAIHQCDLSEATLANLHGNISSSSACQTDLLQQYADANQTLLHQHTVLAATLNSYKVALEQQKIKVQSLTNQLRGARSQATKCKASKEKLQQGISASIGHPVVQTAARGGEGHLGHDPRYMAGVRYIKHACNMSNQRTSLALDLIHQLLTHEAPHPDLHTEVSPSTLSEWNVILGEVDNMQLREKLESTLYDTYVFADDSNKGHEERHIMGVHTWSEPDQGPVGYVLANTLIATSSGKDQADADFHILKNIFGIKDVTAVIGDNASTQSGAQKGQAVELGRLMEGTPFFIGCHPHIVNIALRNAIANGFGSRGSMSEFNLFQLHYKVGYVHHQRPTYYRALYVSQGITTQSPPLPQEFIETRWTYLHEHLEWWNKYGDKCLELGRAVLRRMVTSDSHYDIWRAIIRMAANPILAAERVLLFETLDNLVIPSLRAAQQSDTELQFSSGYLARSWPARVLLDMAHVRLMIKFPSAGLPKTMQSINQHLDGEEKRTFPEKVIQPYVTAILEAFLKHATRWLRPPMFLAMGACSNMRHFFWRAWLRAVFDETIFAAPTRADAALTACAVETRDPDAVVSLAADLKLLKEVDFLLSLPSTQWVYEFVVLAIAMKERSSLVEWCTRWDMHTLLPEIRAVAASVSPPLPSSTTEPLLWAWFCRHVFAMPVHNVLAERQFNLASIYLSPNDSEASKQSSHLFVQNILHSANCSDGGPITREARQISIAKMKDYCATVTQDSVTKARATLNDRSKSGSRDGRTLTSMEVYSGVLDRHRVRSNHQQMMQSLESEGRDHEVLYIAPRRSAAGLAATRSFPAAERGSSA